MCNSLSPCAIAEPPIDPDFHRRVRLHRLGLRGAVARLIAEHAYGEPRDVVMLIANTPASEGVCR